MRKKTRRVEGVKGDSEELLKEEDLLEYLELEELEYW